MRELGKKWHSTQADLDRQTKRTREVEDDMTAAGKLHQQATQVRHLLQGQGCFVDARGWQHLHQPDVQLVKAKQI